MNDHDNKHMESGTQYRGYCTVCDKSFDKLCLYNQHINGKKHKKKMSQPQQTPDELLNELKINCPNWFSSELNSSHVASPWSMTELSTLDIPSRSSTLHPSTMVCDLNCYQKARVWRYCRDILRKGSYNEIATIMAGVDNDVEGHLRVKELFER